MNRPQFVKRMTEEVNRQASVSESHSRAFLKWFLINYFRIDEDEATDYICDNPNDKGIDGIYADLISSDIFIFQSKYSATPDQHQGDTDLKTFSGVRAWFDSVENIQNLDNSIANQELKALINRLELSNKILKDYEINLVFVTNRVFDRNARDYLSVVEDTYDAWDLDRLYDSFTYLGKDIPVHDKFDFQIDEDNVIRYTIAPDVELILFAAKAKQLVQLQGIQDQSLFDRNVRYGLGKTRINREIAKTIKAVQDHDSFILFNNGITMICEGFVLDKGKLQVENYSIVNGCQTVLTLYENSEHIDDKIRIFARAVKIGTDPALSRRITYYNNNQNPISPRDLKSNDKVQEDIKKQILDYFGGAVQYHIKPGESAEEDKLVIRNDFAAQLIVSFVLKEPFNAHQKTKLFTENYSKIFSRHITPPFLFILFKMFGNVDANCKRIENLGARDYGTTRFFVMYLLREIFDKDDIGSTLLGDADSFLKEYGRKLDEAIDKLSKMLVIGFNNYVATQVEGEQYFDYKNILRNEKLMKAMARDIYSKYETSILFHPEGKLSNLLVN